MNIPDHISESLETVFRLKMLKFFDADPGYCWTWIRDLGWKKFRFRIRDKHSGPATLKPEVHHLSSHMRPIILVHIRYTDIFRLLSDTSSKSLQTFASALYGRGADVQYCILMHNRKNNRESQPIAKELYNKVPFVDFTPAHAINLKTTYLSSLAFLRASNSWRSVQKP